MKSASAPARASYHHGDLRNALLEASLELVAKEGVVRFSLREAARAVGVSPAAAYRHFEDKDALLAALAHDAFGRLGHAMERAAAKTPGEPGTAAYALAAFFAVGQGYVEFAVQHPSYFRVMFGPWCEHKEPVTPEGDGARAPYTILVESLDALVAAGVIQAEARPGAELVIWTSTHGLASLLVEGGALELDRAQRAQAIRQTGRTILAGLGAAPSVLGPPQPPLDLDPRGSGNCPARGERRSGGPPGAAKR